MCTFGALFNYEFHMPMHTKYVKFPLGGSHNI